MSLRYLKPILELEPNPDILATVSQKKDKKIIVGFAVETENEKENALKKIKSKNLDLIVVNNPNTSGAAFGEDTNQVILIHKNGKDKQLPLLSKGQVAKHIFDEIIL